MNKDPLVSIIIINYNGKHHLQKCLPSLGAITYKKTEIIVVDNGSDDGSTEYIEKNYPETKVLKNEGNNGFAKANNQGLEVSTGKYILLLNNDTKVEPGFMEPLVNHLQEVPECAAVQSKILLMEEPGKIDSTGSFLTRSGFLKHEGFNETDKGQYNKKRYIFSPKGACMLISKDALIKTTLFDENFFAYFEETDLAWRMWLAGYKINFIPKSVIYHEVGATSSKLRTEFIEYHSFKNRIASVFRNMGTPSLIFTLPANIIISACMAVIFFLSGQSKRSKGVWQAIYWNIVNANTNFKKRKWVQKEIRKVKDKEIFPFILKRKSFSSNLSALRGYLGVKRA